MKVRQEDREYEEKCKRNSDRSLRQVTNEPSEYDAASKSINKKVQKQKEINNQVFSKRVRKEVDMAINLQKFQEAQKVLQLDSDEDMVPDLDMM